MADIKKLRALCNSPKFSESLPITLGENTWEEIVITCRKCGRVLPDEDVRANVSSLIPSVVSVEGVGACRSCKILIPVTIRFRIDGNTEYTQGGRWVKSLGVPIAFLPRISARISAWFKKCLVQG